MEILGAVLVVGILVAAAIGKISDARKKNDTKLKFDLWMRRFRQ